MASRGRKKKKSQKELREVGERAKLIGRLAQKEASLLLSRANLTVNESHEDDEGWDLFVQFPASLAVKAFLDVAPAEHSCLVQVKAIDGDGRRVRMKLSNALKLAKVSMPAFVLVAHVPGDHIENLWVIHCGEDFVEAALKRAVTAHSSPKTSLNKIFVDVPVSDGALVAVDADALKAALLASFSVDQGAYVARKEDWVRNVGYGAARKRLAVVLREAPTDGDYEQMADFAVGLVDRLPVRRVSVSDLRFGCERAEQSFENAELTWPGIPTGPTVDFIVKGGRQEAARLTCTLHSARAVFPFLAERFDRLVFRAPYFVFIARRTGDAVRFTWSLEGFGDGIPLARLMDAAAAARCVRLLRAPGAKLFVADAPQALAIDNLERHGDDDSRSVRFVEDAAMVVRHVEVPHDLTLGMLQLQQGAGVLRILAAALEGEEGDFGLVFPPSALGDEPPVGAVCAVMTASTVRFAGVALVCILAFVGPLRVAANDSEKLSVNGRQLRVVSRRVFRSGEAADTDPMFDAAEALLRNEGVDHVYRR